MSRITRELNAGRLAGVIAHLTANALRYRVLKWTGAFSRPQAVSLEVTHRCVARCRMCNIWRTPRSTPELPGGVWQRFLASPALGDLRELDVTGGEPFLRDDLEAFLLWVAEQSEASIRKLRTVAVTTNGLLTERVLGVTERVADSLEKRGIDLVLACGVDAVGPTHDEMRGVPGAWERVAATLEGLVALREHRPRLVLGLKVTVTPWNLPELETLRVYAEERALFTIVSPAIVTAGRYCNEERAEDLRLGPEETKRLAAFLSRGEATWGIHRQTLLRYFRTGRVRKSCSAGFNVFFVRSTGDLRPCPLIPLSLGNIAREEPGVLLAKDRLRQFRRGVGAFPECRHCTEPGLERFSLPFEGFAYLRFLLRRGPEAFWRVHRELGLDKYV